MLPHNVNTKTRSEKRRILQASNNSDSTMENVIIANNSENYESIQIILNPERFPIAYKNKVEELMEQGAFDTKEKAEHWVKTTPIELELYYEKDSGLFAVESEAIESNSVCSPYSGKDIVCLER